MKDKLKIIFMGTPEFAGIILEKLIASETYKPSLVITRPDKPLGRKQILTPPPVKQRITNYKLRITNKIKILQPKKLKKFIPPRLSGVLNGPASLLPLSRGASPISAAILNADRKTGATIMLIDEELDHGPILAQARVPIASDDTTESLNRKIALAGADLLNDTIPKWTSGTIKPLAQDHSRATHTEMLNKQAGEIKTEYTAEHIERMARAYYPWPGIYLRHETRNLKHETKILKK